MNSTDRAWEDFGKREPYFGVFSKPYFLAKNLDEKAREYFFSTGARHVEQVLGVVHATLDPQFAPQRALDFGCGVGRVAIPLARVAREVVGVDVSESMLVEARKNCERAGVANASFARSDDGLTKLDGEFDFIHSFVVFQHIPKKRGEQLLDALLARLAVGGVGALHFTFASSISTPRKLLSKARASVPLAHNVANLVARQPWGFPHMQMVDYDLRVILERLHASGCHDVHLRYTAHGKHLGAVLFFAKRETPPL